MSDLIAEIEFEAVNSEIDRHLAGRIIAALRALPAVQPDAAAIREAALKSALVAVNHVELFGTIIHDKHVALEQYARCRDAILALIDNTGKEVMPPVPVTNTPNEPDIGPGDQAVAGAAPWPENLFGLTNTRDMHCATEGCGRRVSTRFEGRDYCEPCGRKVALAQKGGA
jgi:hypothetical protein